MTFWLRRCMRAVALAERDDAARAVAEDLHLDVARLLDIALEEHAAAAEVLARQPRHLIEAPPPDPPRGGTSCMPMPPPPAVLLSITGIADALAPRLRAAAASTSRSLPGSSGTPARAASARAVCFRPKSRICAARRAR